MPYPLLRNNHEVVKVLQEVEDDEIAIPKPKQIEDDAWKILKRCFGLNRIIG